MIEADKAALRLFGEIGIPGTWAMKNITPPSFNVVRSIPFDITDLMISAPNMRSYSARFHPGPGCADGRGRRRIRSSRSPWLSIGRL